MTTDDVKNAPQPEEQEVSGAEAPRPETRANLFDRQRTIYSTALEENLNEGLARYGFAFFHSLEDEDRVLYEEKIGLKPDSAVDFFNLGTANALKGNLEKALEQLQQALKMDADLGQALFNAGLVCEKMGKSKEARQYYEKYLGLTNNEEEKTQLQERLATL
jgi:tetratricopeptide (TPR) repeat protein